MKDVTPATCRAGKTNFRKKTMHMGFWKPQAYREQEKNDFFDNAGIKLLRDTVVVIDNEFCLAGRLDDGFYERRTVNALLEIAVDTLPLVMLDHRPTKFPEVIATKTDAQLSGHTHHGQMFPMSLILNRMYVLSYGYRLHFYSTFNSNRSPIAGISTSPKPFSTSFRRNISLLSGI